MTSFFRPRRPEVLVGSGEMVVCGFSMKGLSSSRSNSGTLSFESVKIWIALVDSWSSPELSKENPTFFLPLRPFLGIASSTLSSLVGNKTRAADWSSVALGKSCLRGVFAGVGSMPTVGFNDPCSGRKGSLGLSTGSMPKLLPGDNSEFA